MTMFFLIRHAACDGLGQTLWGRTPGVCLNEEGKLQARELAEAIAGTTFDAIYSSPLERAYETADAIACRMKLEVMQSEALNEIEYGEWSAKSFAELSADERWRHFNEHRSIASVPGGESFLEVQNRVVKEIDRLSEKHGDARIALVTHADVIRAAISYFDDTQIELLLRGDVPPCGIHRLHRFAKAKPA